MHSRYFTSESVTEGHPDKVADRISDAVVDAVLTEDPNARIACETLVTTNRVIVAGELGTHVKPDIDTIVREAVRDIGYIDIDGFRADDLEIENLIHQQSADIADGVEKSLEARRGSSDEGDQLGAGDQGLMFGFATNETEQLMPMPIDFAHRLAKRLSVVRKGAIVDYLRPDGKTQVTVRYDGKVPVEVTQVLISTQHADGIGHDDLEKDLFEHVIAPVIPEPLRPALSILINPSGRFVIGGPNGDAGLTGRKIIVDTYGGYARHGGGAFSGKDATKVDRSAAYAARYAAKNVVAAGLADSCELQLSYAIGQAEPFSIYTETFGTEKVDTRIIEELLKTYFDFRPQRIIQDLSLQKPVFAPTAAYGHFGREEFRWEQTDKAEMLRAASGLS